MGHRVTVARSRSLIGVYEPCPYNPIMRQEDEGATIQRCGHGDLVETSDGRWYMVYLCGRPLRKSVQGDDTMSDAASYTILGRETALDPVTWTADGWPIVNGHKGPSCMQVKPFAQPRNIDINHNRVFPLNYMTPRSCEKGAICCGTDELGDFFEIKGSKAPLSSLDARNILLTRQTEFTNTYSVILEIPVLKEGQSAGITGYYDENTHVLFGIKNISGKLCLFVKEHIGDEDRERQAEISFAPEIRYLRLVMETDFLKRKFYYSALKNLDDEMNNNTLFAELNDVYYLCDEGLKRGKRFTGALLGMYCYAGNDEDISCRFYEVEYIVG